MLPSRSGILAINTRLPPLGLHKRTLNSPCLILLSHTKHKIILIKWYLGLTPRLHFPEGELTYWVSFWLIVDQLPIKAGWWDIALAIRDFSRGNKQTILYWPRSSLPKVFSNKAVQKINKIREKIKRNAVKIKCFNNSFRYHQLTYCTCCNLKGQRCKI